MKRLTEFTVACAMLLCVVAFCVWMFCLSKIQNECELMRINPLIMCAFLLICYLLNSIAARRGISLSLYVIIQLLLSAAGVYLLLSTVELSPGGTGTRVLISVIFAGGVITSAVLAMEPPQMNSIVTSFDAMVFAALILLLLDRVLELPAAGTAVATCLAAAALTLVALIAARVEREGARASVRGSPVAGRALIAGLFAAMGALAALLAAFASGGVRSLSEAALAAVRWCWGIILAAARLVLGLIERFLMWLSQFISDEPPAAELPVQGVSIPAGDMAMEEVSLPPWVGYAALGIGAAALLWLLIRMRRERAGGRTVLRRGPRGGETRQSGLGEALRGLLLKLRGELGYRINCLRLRKTPAGLLAWCERRAPKGAKRAASESGSEFLLRLAALGPGAEQGAALEKLAALVERSFYSPRRAADVEPELYRAVRRCRFSLPEEA